MLRQLTHSTYQPRHPADCTIPLQNTSSGISSLIEKLEALSLHISESTWKQLPFNSSRSQLRSIMPTRQFRDPKAAIFSSALEAKGRLGCIFSSIGSGSMRQDIFTTPSKASRKWLTPPCLGKSNQSNIWSEVCVVERRDTFPNFISQSELEDSKFVTDAQSDIHRKTVKEKILFFLKDVE